VTRAPLSLLEALVSIPSHVSQSEGITAMGELVGAELAALGFERVDPERPERRAPAWAEALLSPEVGFDGLADPAVWTRPGQGDGRLLLLGDLDAALALPPEACRLVVRDDRAIGPAVADMKGGLVVMLEALRHLDREGRPTPPITVVLSGDEQAGSPRSASTIRRHGADATWALCMECARDGGRLMQSRGHIGIGRLVATGTAAHAGSALEAGRNAVTLLARGILRLEEAGLDDATATVTPTILRGGTRRSIVPDVAEVVLDVRARDEAAWDHVEATLRHALQGVDSAQRLTADLYCHRPGLIATDRTAWLLGMIAARGREFGLSIAATDSLAAGSSAFLDSSRTAVMDGMGPAGGALMTPEEYVILDSIQERAALLANTISSLPESALEPALS
jgi:glutamate carboxypeptidase